MWESTWTVIIPAKRLSQAKTRLLGALADVPHEDLVLALAMDTVAAALACPLATEVVVVTDDPVIAAAAGNQGARVLADPGGGLNAVLMAGARTIGSPARPVVAIPADLPALDPAHLAAALTAAGSGTDDTTEPQDAAGYEARCAARSAFAVDAAGSGTTLLAAAVGAVFDPRFGPGSAAAHTALGYRRLHGAWPTLRQDVDTAADLVAAERLGVGPHTAALLRQLR